MIAIPNMDMPKSCWECRLMDGEANCLVTDEGIPFKQEEIHPDCPLIDIVRCGECKWCDNKGKGRALICTNPYIDMDIHPLGFCSYGERRAE